MIINKLMKRVTNTIKAYSLMDRGRLNDSILLAGMGRSGTTWVADLINYDNSYRVLFEPFFPAKVSAAKNFEYIQYLNSNYKNSILTKKAQKILAGRVRNYWVNKNNSGIIYHKRIIKDIRTNLMLGWLKSQDLNIPIILVIRHPLQVVSSWLKLGWGKEALGNRFDFDIIFSQQSLLDDFPVITEVLNKFKPQSMFEKLVFQWCVFYYVPLQQLKTGDAFLLFYENILTQPLIEIAKMFQYIGRTFNRQDVEAILPKSSCTNYLNRDFIKDQSLLLNSWNSEFSHQQIQWTINVLKAFGLDSLYDQNGLPNENNHLRLNTS